MTRHLPLRQCHNGLIAGHKDGNPLFPHHEQVSESSFEGPHGDDTCFLEGDLSKVRLDRLYKVEID